MSTSSPAGGSTPDPLFAADQDGADLLVRHAAGDGGAFELFVHLHAQGAFRLAVRLTGHRSDAEDATQSAFILAHQRAATFQPRTSARAWFGAIVVNCCHQLRRRERRLAERHRRAGDLLGVPQEPSCDHEDRDVVAAELAAMGESERLALWLRHGEGLRFREIAERLRIPQKTVESRVQRAVVHLRARLLARGRRAGGRGTVLALLTASWPVLPRPGLAVRASNALVARVAAQVAGVGSAALIQPRAATATGHLVRWLPTAVPAAALTVAVLASLAVRARWPDAKPATQASVPVGGQPVIDHDDPVDLFQRVLYPADPAAPHRPEHIRFNVTVFRMRDDLVGRLALFPPGPEQVVLPAARSAAPTAAAETGDGQIQVHTRQRLECFSGQRGSASYSSQYAYIHDYALLPTGPDPRIKNLTCGQGIAVCGEVCRDRVRLTQCDYLDLSLMRCPVSSFEHARESQAGGRVTSVYPVEEPELEQRFAPLTRPVLLARDEVLVMRVPPAELHRLRAPVARSLGAAPTGEGFSKRPADAGGTDWTYVLEVRAEVVVVPADHAEPEAPVGVTRR